MADPEKETTRHETEQKKPSPKAPRELTPEERGKLRKKIEETEKHDPNIHPIF
jgi:hypothetical protein